MHSRVLVAFVALGLGLCLGCESDDESGETTESTEEVSSEAALSGEIGPDGGTLSGALGTELAGVQVVFPEGAFSAATLVEVERVVDSTPLPDGAFAVGEAFRVIIEGEPPQAPFQLVMPFDSTLAADFEQDFTQVKVWFRNPEGWSLLEPVETAPDLVTIESSDSTTFAPGVKLE